MNNAGLGRARQLGKRWEGDGDGPRRGLTTLLSSRVVSDRPMKNMVTDMTVEMVSPCAIQRGGERAFFDGAARTLGRPCPAHTPSEPRALRCVRSHFAVPAISLGDEGWVPSQ